MGAGGEAGRREAGLNRPDSPPAASAALARFVAGSRWEDVPDAIRHEGKRGILNVLGCILAGRDDPAVELVRKTFPLKRRSSTRPRPPRTTTTTPICAPSSMRRRR